MIRSFLKKRLIGKGQNLVSVEEPYQMMRDELVGDYPITNILDVGASNGRISKRLLKNFPQARIHAFEPNQMYRETLERLSEQETRFTPYMLALSDHVGHADLHITKKAGSTSLLLKSENLSEHGFDGTKVDRIERVELSTIDDWSSRNGIESVELMKFDIQGAELMALRGASETLQSTLVIYAEIWFNPVYEGACLLTELDTFLREHGFVLYDFFKPGYSKKGLLLWANAIFVHAKHLGY